MRKKEFASALRSQTANVRVSPELRRRTMDAVYGKEQKTVKKRIPAAVLAIVLSVLFCTAALAAAGRAGILDFLGDYAYVKQIPEDAQTYIKQDVLETGSELVDVKLSELYYDGFTARIAVQLQPKDDKILLLGTDTRKGDPWSDMLGPNADASDERTVLDVFREGGYTEAWCVGVSVPDQADDRLSRGEDWRINEDGSMSVYCEQRYQTDLPERDAQLLVTLRPYLDAAGEVIETNPEDILRIEEPLKLVSAAASEQILVSTEAVQFPTVGLQVDQLQLHVKPQEIYAFIHYSVYDEAAYNQKLPEGGILGEDVSFELIDADSAESSPSSQRLQEGLSGTGSTHCVSGDGDEVQRFVQVMSIGRGELHESYTLRAFDYMNKTRYETASVQMREATEEDLTAYPVPVEGE